ncbi:MAG TPA: hypothetical protein ENN29_11945 [Candidatus Hydrogenedentes bacterium]|nr:hypothetical protein [Candidatus Hydrogenedentota bacterium]
MFHLLAAVCIAWPQLFHPVHLALAHAPGGHCEECPHQTRQPDARGDSRRDGFHSNTTALHDTEHACKFCVAFEMSGGYKCKIPYADNKDAVVHARSGIPLYFCGMNTADILPRSDPRAPPFFRLS